MLKHVISTENGFKVSWYVSSDIICQVKCMDVYGYVVKLTVLKVTVGAKVTSILSLHERLPIQNMEFEAERKGWNGNRSSVFLFDFFKGNIGKRMKNIEKRVFFGVEHFFQKVMAAEPVPPEIGIVDLNTVARGARHETPNTTPPRTRQSDQRKHRCIMIHYESLWYILNISKFIIQCTHDTWIVMTYPYNKPQLNHRMWYRRARQWYLTSIEYSLVNSSYFCGLEPAFQVLGVRYLASLWLLVPRSLLIGTARLELWIVCIVWVATR